MNRILGNECAGGEGAASAGRGAASDAPESR